MLRPYEFVKVPLLYVNPVVALELASRVPNGSTVDVLLASAKVDMRLPMKGTLRVTAPLQEMLDAYVVLSHVPLFVAVVSEVAASAMVTSAWLLTYRMH